MNWSTWGKELVQYFINTSIASTVIFSRIVDLLIKIENCASYTELNLLPCSLPVVAIIVTWQIFLHYNTTIINNWTPPSEPIFLGAPLFRSKIPYDPPPFFASPPTVINNECMHGPLGPLRHECGFNENFIFMWRNTPNEFVTCDGLIGDGKVFTSYCYRG
jgi:hypothetical protein